MDVMEQADAELNQENFKSKSISSRKPCRAKNHFVSPADIHENVEKMMQEAIDVLDDRVIDISEQAAVKALDTCDVSHN